MGKRCVRLLDHGESCIAKFPLDLAPRRVVIERTGDGVPEFDGFIHAPNAAYHGRHAAGELELPTMSRPNEERYDERSTVGSERTQLGEELDSGGAAADVDVSAPADNDRVERSMENGGYGIGIAREELHTARALLDEILTDGDEMLRGVEARDFEPEGFELEEFSSGARAR